MRHLQPQPCASRRFTSPTVLLIVVIAALVMGGCDQYVLGLPKSHMTPKYTPQTNEFSSEPAAVWNALVAEMAAEGGQRPVVLDGNCRIGSWAMTLKDIVYWNDYACEGYSAKAPAWGQSREEDKQLDNLKWYVLMPWLPLPTATHHEGQGLTTGFVEAVPGGHGSALHLTRVYLCDTTTDIMMQSRGNFERDLVSGMRARLGETAAVSSDANKAGNP